MGVYRIDAPVMTYAYAQPRIIARRRFTTLGRLRRGLLRYLLIELSIDSAGCECYRVVGRCWTRRGASDAVGRLRWELREANRAAR